MQKGTFVRFINVTFFKFMRENICVIGFKKKKCLNNLFCISDDLVKRAVK